MRALMVAAIGGVALVTPAAAQTSAPAAIVEDVRGNIPGVEFMDYVYPGKVIKLGSSGTIVLNYLNSCVRETVTGGVVVVGLEQSKVSLAEIQTAKVDCTAPKANLSENEASQGAATTFRSITPARRPNAADGAPVAIVYGVSPVFDVGGRGKLVIERTDVAGERQEVAIDKAALFKGRFYDIAKAGRSLTPGASYAATFGNRKLAFRIAPLAQPDAPLAGRLLRF